MLNFQEDIGVTKKTSTSMGTSDIYATSQVDPKDDGPCVEREIEKKRKKEGVLSTEPPNTQAETKKAKKKKNKESNSPCKSKPTVSIQDERTEQPQDPEVAAQFDNANKPHEDIPIHKDETKSQENPSPSKVKLRISFSHNYF
jgi:hypothetical protein